MAYQTQYNRAGQPIGTYWVNEGENLQQSINRQQDEAGFQATPPDATMPFPSPSAQLSHNPSSTAVDPPTSVGEPKPSPWPTDEAGELTLQSPSGGEKKTIKSGQHIEIDKLTRSGWRPLNKNGKPMHVVDWKGGQMFVDPETGNASPLNVLLGGQPTAEQTAGMQEFQRSPQYTNILADIRRPTYTPPPPSPPPNHAPPINPASSPGNPLPTTGGVGNATTNPEGIKLPDDIQDVFKMLSTTGLNRMLQSNGLVDLATGQLSNAQNRVNQTDTRLNTVDDFINSMMASTKSNEQWRNDVTNQLLYEQPGGGPGLIDSLKNSISQAGKDNEWRNQLVNQILYTQPGQSSPGTGLLESAQKLISHADDQPGFTPQGRAALRLSQTEGIPRQFNEAMQSAYSELARRGAIGGELPGSQADMMRTLAPIYAAQAGAYTQANTQSILTEEQLKQQQLLSNRQNAAGAIGTLSGLTGTLGQMYDPTKYNEIFGQAGNLVNTLGQMYDPSKTAAQALGGINAGTGLVNAGTSALEAGTGAVNAATGAYTAGNQPLQTSVNAATGYAETLPSSFKNMLLQAMISTGLNNLPDIIKAIGGLFGGNNPNNPGTTNNPGTVTLPGGITINLPTGGVPGLPSGTPSGQPPQNLPRDEFNASGDTSQTFNPNQATGNTIFPKDMNYPQPKT